MERSKLLPAFKKVVEKRKEEIMKWDKSKEYWYEVFVIFGSDDSTKSLFLSEDSSSLIESLINERELINNLDIHGNFIVHEDGKEHKVKDFGIDLWRMNEQSGPELFKVLVL